MLRKISLVLLVVVVAGISSWLKFGDIEVTRRWLAGLQAPSLPVPSAPAPPAEESLPVRQGFNGTATAVRDVVMVLHFRRADAAEDAMAKAQVKVTDADGTLRKDLSAWAAFRQETPAGASLARIAVGPLPPGSYRVTVEMGSRQGLGVKRAAIELSSREADSVWNDLAKTK